MSSRSILMLILLLLLPALSIWSMRGQLGVVQRQRLQVYSVGALTQWVLVIACLWVVWLDGQWFDDIGLKPFGEWTTTLLLGLGVTAALVVVGGAMLWVQSKRRWRESEFLLAFLPDTPSEKLAFIGLAATAGFCEEILFRGFAIVRLSIWTGGLWSAAVIAVIVFSLGHLYQGIIGVVRSGLLGAVLAAVFIATGSLAPGMIAHFLLDVMGGVWGRKLIEMVDSRSRIEDSPPTGEIRNTASHI